MSGKFKKLILGLFIWTAAITALHFRLNVDMATLMNDRLPFDKRKLNVAYIPVT